MPSYQHLFNHVLDASELLPSEISSMSRNYNGYTLFSKHYYIAIKEDAWSKTNGDSLYYSDSSDVDSTDGSTINNLCSARVKLSHMWNSLQSVEQEKWRQRAKRLNSYPSIGSFLTVPESLSHGVGVSVQRLLHGLTSDWRRLVKITRKALMKDPTRNQSVTTYTFVSEKVTLGTQSFRSFGISELLKEAVFGLNFSLPQVLQAIVYQSKNRVLLYFASARHLSEVLGINRLSAVQFIHHHHTYICCGKVSVRIGSKSVLGYVMEENEKYFYVLLCSNIRVKVCKPILVTKYGNNSKVKEIFYDYSVCVGDKVTKYVITYFWPVRFKFNKNAIDNIIFILNKVVLDKNLLVNEALSS